MVLLNYLNSVTRTKTFVGSSEIGISVTVKHVQHAGIISAFCLTGGTEKTAGLWFACGDTYPGRHYVSDTKAPHIFQLIYLRKMISKFLTLLYRPLAISE